MDRDPSANQIDPIERETSPTGDSETGEVGDEAARIMKERRKKGSAPEHGSNPVQTKATPDP